MHLIVCFCFLRSTKMPHHGVSNIYQKACFIFTAVENCYLRLNLESWYAVLCQNLSIPGFFRRIWLPENLYFIVDTKYVKAMWSFLGNDIAPTSGKLIQFFFENSISRAWSRPYYWKTHPLLHGVSPTPKFTNYYFLLNWG